MNAPFLRYYLAAGRSVRNCKISCVPTIDASSCESARAICRAKESPDEKFMQS